MEKNKAFRYIVIKDGKVNEIIGLCVLDKDMKGECIDKYTIVANKDDVMAYICVNWVDEVYFAMDYSRIPQEMIKGLAVAGFHQ